MEVAKSPVRTFVWDNFTCPYTNGLNYERKCRGNAPLAPFTTLHSKLWLHIFPFPPCPAWRRPLDPPYSKPHIVQPPTGSADPAASEFRQFQVAVAKFLHLQSVTHRHQVIAYMVTVFENPKRNKLIFTFSHITSIVVWKSSPVNALHTRVGYCDFFFKID